MDSVPDLKRILEVVVVAGGWWGKVGCDSLGSVPIWVSKNRYHDNGSRIGLELFLSTPSYCLDATCFCTQYVVSQQILLIPKVVSRKYITTQVTNTVCQSFPGYKSFITKSYSTFSQVWLLIVPLTPVMSKKTVTYCLSSSQIDHLLCNTMLHF